MTDHQSLDPYQYRIEKLRHPVSIVFTGGGTLAGEMFVAAIARFRSGAESPLDVLNEQAPFFPLRTRDGETVLVCKGQVALLAAEVPESEDPLDAAQMGLQVAVTLASGGVHEGVLFPEVTPDRPRLLDFLNAFHDPFLPMYAVGRMLLINRQQIAHVRALP